MNVLFAATLAFSSFLMFWLEPMIAKMLLPTLGGSPAVWNTCLLFFQTSLLVGYGMAHLGHRLGVRTASIAIVVLLIAASLSLPLAVRQTVTLDVSSHPIGWLLEALTRAIGLPFLALSVCTPLLQRLFGETQHASARDPYFLYAASNTGSLLALSAYVLLVEPRLPLTTQTRLWSAGFMLLGPMVAACVGLAIWKRDRVASLSAARTAKTTVPLTWSRRSTWVALAFAPSSLLLAVTTYISTDVAAAPLLWTLPLAIYLVSFIVAFATGGSGWVRVARARLPLVVTALVVFMAAHVGRPLWLVLPIHLLAFAAVATACHGRLADDRPPVAHLTEFYLLVAFGGMLGGLFNSFIASAVFSSVAEYPIVLVLAAALTGHADRRPSWTSADVAIPALVGLLTAVLLVGARLVGGTSLVLTAVGLAAVLAFSQSSRRVRFAASLGAILVASVLVWNPYGDVLRTSRTFFGVHRVTSLDGGRQHALFHGTTLHGVQNLRGAERGRALMYYHRGGPFGQAYDVLGLSNESEVAAVGLGVGSLATYAHAGQRWTFYEIDSMVEAIARSSEYFTHLSDCGAACAVVIGDARVSLTRATGAQYGVIVLDAFSSDAIPIHLMTREALVLYLSRLTPDGVLAFHISNRHLALGPVLGRLAQHLDLAAVEQIDQPSEEERAHGRSPSHWVVMARDRRDAETLLDTGRWQRVPSDRSAPLWTDDFSNLLQVLNVTQGH